jgi:hypothetical protein
MRASLPISARTVASNFCVAASAVMPNWLRVQQRSWPETVVNTARPTMSTIGRSRVGGGPL